ncbi:hypothetical protein CAOG_08006 [Capsaspora owczarzaki ATCC 30864]|uniref:hypothetical protein n=1 Tax=Capsaspora owczarzaki (strain ATCC 30864) TaxID=595528 RepID=UPI00035259BF|nr:hypothetical protein CAOG_08006 [Capsaspora owczarzaki ATCC 30864]|eukprot:XP_004342607.2 hypothetical protein CAOG_08006 [Capsaspora owczarzaki ATCC 30864]
MPMSAGAEQQGIDTRGVVAAAIADPLRVNEFYAARLLPFASGAAEHQDPAAAAALHGGDDITSGSAAGGHPSPYDASSTARVTGAAAAHFFRSAGLPDDLMAQTRYVAE